MSLGMSLGFQLSQKIRWKGLPIKEAAHDELNSYFPPTERGRQLVDRYGLVPWSGKLSRSTWDELLGTLDLLDQIPVHFFGEGAGKGAKDGRVFNALDVGAKSWRYLGALKSWLERQFSADVGSIALTGVELDAFRLYRNLRTGFSYGRYFAKQFSEEKFCCRYEAMDVLDWQKRADLISWFFPFVTPSAHLAWGLPEKLFEPAAIFSHVERLLYPGGRLLMANPGEWEWEIAKQLMGRLKLIFETRVTGSLHPSPYPIFVSVWSCGG